ncbi:hypothetical protein [Mucilaginibacter sp. UYCu711]|uniref:hypothetical protein n=1 Tax=Mucilaginibacter sp. UYCu711 TaxID=3156339 RepID=UPI003D1AA3F7
MKNLLLLLIALVGLSVHTIAQTPQSAFELKDKTYSFYQIKQGVPVTHTFDFKMLEKLP